MRTEVVVDAIRMNGTDQKRTCMMGGEPGLSSGEERHLGEVRNTGANTSDSERMLSGERKEPGDSSVSEIKRGEIFQEKDMNHSVRHSEITCQIVLQRGHRICRLRSHE